MALTMESSVRFLKGVGAKRAEQYAKLGIETVEDLLYHLPRKYLDFTSPSSVLTAVPGDTAAIRAVVSAKSREQRIRKGLSVFKVRAVDETGELLLTFYNAKYTAEALEVGREYLFYGQVEGGTRKEIQSPLIFPADGKQTAAVYPLTMGLSSKMLSRHIETALRELSEIPETVPRFLREQYGLAGRAEAFRMVHLPETPEQAEQGRRRLVFEELLCLSLGMAELKQGRAQEQTEPMHRVEMEPFYRNLPFTPTAGQLSAIGDAVNDLCSGRPMNRLVQGDVGSGKTLVAAALFYFTAKNGRSGAMMAPTSILAEQHCRTMRGFLEPLGLRVGLLTGALSAKEKRLVREQLAAGEIDLCIGTHALLTENVNFRNLGLVVTDEQHRFGVRQRMTLSGKGKEIHTLVMSATPIPRTLALILYGDLELSVIRERPAGRQKVDTFLIDSAKRERAFGFVRNHLDRGLQAYVVCPLVEQPEEETAEQGRDRKAASEWAEQLAEGSFRGYRVGLLHGRMKPKEKEAVMREFAEGKIQLLVSTTVIEVGVDVPNSVIMMVENAERFGLSQLHQLRGRDGRGKEKSYCILLSDSTNPDTVQRLKTLCRTEDGFEVAQADLEQRGPGDFFGTRQHGLPALRTADLMQDSGILEQTRQAAADLLSRDPGLARCTGLRRRVSALMESAAVL